MTVATSAPATAIGRVRFSIAAMLFAVTIVNYADRATIAIAGPVMSRDLGLSAVQMGFVFSAFGWSCVSCKKLIFLQYLVGAAGFEPTTCSTQNCRATRLRYTPIIWETSSIHA